MGAAISAASNFSSSDLTSLSARPELAVVRVVARFEAEDGVAQQNELMFDVKPGATAGWLLSRVIETLQRERPEAPHVIGLKVLNARPTASTFMLPRVSMHGAVAAAACSAFCAGEKLTQRQEAAYAGNGCMPFVSALSVGDDALVLDYSQPLQDALSGGDAFEAVFEVSDPNVDGTAMCAVRETDIQGFEGSAPSRHCIEDYQIIRVVGVGGSGRVIQAMYRPSREMRAVKVMSKARLYQQEQRLQRVITEKRILARLRHPFVVSLHWAFQTSTHLFLVLDFCGGGELFFHMLQRGRFEEPDAMFYFCEILLGLEYLHSQQVLYRDLKARLMLEVDPGSVSSASLVEGSDCSSCSGSVALEPRPRATQAISQIPSANTEYDDDARDCFKPENCLLDDDGHIRLTDFGLSKDNLTQSALFTSFVGTAGYLSPEMVARQGHGFPLDYYCLGCLLYCLLTGSLPHYEGDYKAMIQRRVKGEPCALPPWLSIDVQHLLKGLLAPDPAERLGSKYGAIEVKEHPWLSEVDWTRVYRREPQPCFPNFPPVLPQRETAANFASEFTTQAAPEDLLGFSHEKGGGPSAHLPPVEGFSQVREA